VIQHNPAHGSALGSLQCSATDAEFLTSSIYSPTYPKLYQAGEIQPEVHGSLFPLFFSNQISLAGHSSAVLPLAMPFYFNGTSFVRLTRKASVSRSEPAGNESGPNWECAGILRGAQNLADSCGQGEAAQLPQCGRNLLCLHGHDLRNTYDSSQTQR